MSIQHRATQPILNHAKAVMNIDLHTHTTASDGTVEPEKLVELAVERGISVLAITDHDTISGIARARAYGESRRVEVVPGIELNAERRNVEVHILGYFIDTTDKTLLTWLEKLRNDRIERIHDILKKLRHLDLPVEYEEVMKHAKGESVGRPHIARVLVEKKYVGEFQEAFERFLRPGGMAYVPRPRFLPEEAVELVASCGGIPVLAHPGFIQADDRAVDYLRDFGLDGIEVFYPFHTSIQVEYYKEMALRKKLHVTGGSDFHGFEAGSFRDIGVPGYESRYYEEMKRGRTVRL
jgi:predicted metal-dependent phosphoesterase TrpH